MPDTTTPTVDQLTDKVLDIIGTCQYRPERATLRIQFMLHGNQLNPGKASHILNGVVKPAVELRNKAETYIADPVWACEMWEDFIAPDQLVAWSRRRADELRGEADELVRDYLTNLLGGDQ